MKKSKSFLLVIVLVTFITGISQSQNLYTKDATLDYYGASFEFSFPLPETMEENTKQGMYLHLSLPGMTTTMEPGKPVLPVFSKLIEVPLGATPVVQIDLRNAVSIPVNHQVYPFQPSLSKSDDPSEVPFYYDKEAYLKDNCSLDGNVSIVEVGVLRDKRLFRLSVSPYTYHPKKNYLTVYTNATVNVSFDGADIPGTKAWKQRYISNINSTTRNVATLPVDVIPSQTPITYAIVSDRMFESQLEPFITWKEQKGFKVIVGYTDLIGTTTTAIKSWLEGLYNTPATGYSPPQFLLLVGDIGQIPAWSGTAGYHKTDLYYAEYTGDILPDLYYGRFSANSVSELQPQIDKTLEYETYSFSDPSYLDEVVMVAGADAGHSQTYGNGQINYGTGYYFNSAHGLLSHTYLQPEPSGANYSSNIKQNVSDGVAYANYTAHCSTSGWSNPSFSNGDVAALQNDGEYCLMVGNCCSSGNFSSTCFGETVLRAANKGAVGYIGGTNSTYWDEDFWWGVGVEPISANPVYHAGNLGAYDRFFHDMPGVTRDDWFVTQGELPSAGNLAVTQSGSSRITYYWEIYMLFGDPSLSIWLSQPPVMPASYPFPVAGMTEMAIVTDSDVLVAMKVNDSVVGAQVTPQTDTVTFIISAFQPGDTVIITATHFGYQPLIDTTIVSDLSTQTISLSEGWNGVSTYLNLTDSVTQNIMNQISDTLIIMKDLTSVFWPPYANNLPYWVGNSGYMIKVEDDCTLQLSGTPVLSEDRLLSEGWNLMAVRSSQPVDVVALFDNCVNNLIIVKAIDGSGVYWPSVGINSIGALLPGKAYMVKVDEDCWISF